MTPDRDATIRSAQVDLVCNQTYTHHSEWEAQVSASVTRARTGVRTSELADFAGGMKVEQRTESYVHSTVTTLKDTLFRADVTETRRVDLRIDPTPPKRLRVAAEADRNAAAAWSFAWTLSVSLDVARGRDSKVEREVRIKLPPPGRNDQREATHVQAQATYRSERIGRLPGSIYVCHSEPSEARQSMV